MAKKKTNTNTRTTKPPSFLKRYRKTIIIVLAVWVVLVLAGVGLIIAKNEADKQAVEDTIASCISETKKNPLGFTSKCYEENDREVPDDVRSTDKNRVDRILTQAAYDLCMANASFSKDAHWDLNDEDKLNGKLDSSYSADYVQSAYEQSVRECEKSSPLTNSYEAGFKTVYKKEFIGWKEPKNYAVPSENIPLVNRYNSDGKIEEYSGIASDVALPDDFNGTVGGQIAEDFKKEHPDWWY